MPDRGGQHLPFHTGRARNTLPLITSVPLHTLWESVLCTLYNDGLQGFQSRTTIILNNADCECPKPRQDPDCMVPYRLDMDLAIVVQVVVAAAVSGGLVAVAARPVAEAAQVVVGQVAEEASQEVGEWEAKSKESRVLSA